MKTTKRFDEAVTKLYNAFNEGNLNAYKCKACAVGNICNNTEEWGEIAGFYANNFHNTIPENIPNYLETGYSTLELMKVEDLFMNPINFVTNKTQEEFNGLMTVIKYLAELDGIEVPTITVEQFESVLERESV